MTAIVTDKFRQANARELLQRITDAKDNYYLGICRSVDWDSPLSPPAPTVAPDEEFEARKAKPLDRAVMTSL